MCLLHSASLLLVLDRGLNCACLNYVSSQARILLDAGLPSIVRHHQLLKVVQSLTLERAAHVPHVDEAERLLCAHAESVVA